jgi:hypothetical protein
MQMVGSASVMETSPIIAHLSSMDAGPCTAETLMVCHTGDTCFDGSLSRRSCPFGDPSPPAKVICLWDRRALLRNFDVKPPNQKPSAYMAVSRHEIINYVSGRTWTTAPPVSGPTCDGPPRFIDCEGRVDHIDGHCNWQHHDKKHTHAARIGRGCHYIADRLGNPGA